MSEDHALERKSFAPNSLVFDEGTPGDAAYLITQGEVEIRVGIHGDHPRTLAKVGKGEIVGEMALFDGNPRIAAAVATTDTTVIQISREAFRGRLDDIDPVLRSIVLCLVRRLREMSKELTDLQKTTWKQWK